MFLISVIVLNYQATSRSVNVFNNWPTWYPAGVQIVWGTVQHINQQLNIHRPDTIPDNVTQQAVTENFRLDSLIRPTKGDGFRTQCNLPGEAFTGKAIRLLHCQQIVIADKSGGEQIDRLGIERLRVAVSKNFPFFISTIGSEGDVSIIVHTVIGRHHGLIAASVSHSGIQCER